MTIFTKENVKIYSDKVLFIIEITKNYVKLQYFLPAKKTATEILKNRKKNRNPHETKINRMGKQTARLATLLTYLKKSDIIGENKNVLFWKMVIKKAKNKFYDLLVFVAKFKDLDKT